MQIGYARVSTKDQNLELQLNALKAAGCQRIYEEQVSGTKRERPELARALDHAREGDTLVVWKLDRLGRSVRDLIDFVQRLEREGINFRSLTDNIDTSTPSGRFFFHMMASLAQMERELLLERTRAGLEAAKAQGRVGGRARALTGSKLESAKRLIRSGMPRLDVARTLNVSLATIYRHVPIEDEQSSF